MLIDNNIPSIHRIFSLEDIIRQGVAQSGSASVLGTEGHRFESCHLESKSESTKNTKINRPLSPHPTIYKPQLTPTFPISHRISGALLGAAVRSPVITKAPLLEGLGAYPTARGTEHIAKAAVRGHSSAGLPACPRILCEPAGAG